MARLGRLMIAAGLTLFVGLGAVAVMAAVLLTRLDARLDRMPDVFTSLGHDRPADTAESTFLIHIVDSQSGPAAAAQTGRPDGTVLIAHVAESGPKATIVALPSHAPSTAVGTAAGSGARPHLGHLVATVEETTALHVDHVAVLDLAALPTLVDAIGGVDLPLPDSKAYSDTPARQGFVRVDGAQALAWVRGGSGGPARVDRDRTHRRLVVLSALVHAQHHETLLNPPALDRLLSALAASVRVDETLGTREVWQLAGRLAWLRSKDVRFVTAPPLVAESVSSSAHVDERWAALWTAVRSESLAAYLRQHPEDRFRWWAR